MRNIKYFDADKYCEEISSSSQSLTFADVQEIYLNSLVMKIQDMTISMYH